MIRYIELIEPFDQNGYTPNSVMASSPNGDWVLYSEAQAEIDALKAQNAELLALLKQCRVWMADGENSDDSEFYPDYAEPAYIRVIQGVDAAIAKARSDELGVQS